MDWNQQLDQLRGEINRIDAGLAALFEQRMAVTRRVATLKMENNLPILDAGREQAVVERAQGLVADENKGDMALFMRSVMAISRSAQRRQLFLGGAALLPDAAPPPPAAATRCAYQGIPGAWGEEAAATMFSSAQLTSCAQFSDVFDLVAAGQADYGVIPIANSKTGAIDESHELLRRHGLFIVGRIDVAIRQCLLGVPGATKEGVQKVRSHPEALKQCRGVLQAQPWAQESCRNTAVAAQSVAQANDPSIAAIASRRAAEIYGLEVLQPDIMDARDNHTTFVAVAKAPQYTAQSDRISITFAVRHTSGALCEVLMPFLAGNINLLHIESRPAPGGASRFFAEIQGNITQPHVASALRQSAACADYLEVLGCYSDMNTKEMHL